MPDVTAQLAHAPGWSPPPFDALAFRERVRAMPIVTFDELDTTPKHIAGRFEVELDLIIENGWERHGQHMPSFKRPINWSGFDRSFMFHLHAWEPLTFLLKGVCTVRSKEKAKLYHRVSRDYALDWVDKFQVPVLGVAPEETLSEDWVGRQGFAWYDMAVGQRIYRLAYLLELECRDPDGDPAVIEKLYQALAYHHDVLRVESFFRAHSNHGLYQALGQLAAAARFASVDAMSREARPFARSRLAQTLDHHFTADQVHKEHSPGYHWMILGSLIGAQQTDLIDDTETKERIAAMETALAWLAKPDFSLAEFGDTDPRRIARGKLTDGANSNLLALRYKLPALQAIFSAGRIGSLPPTGVKAFLQAGYAVARLPRESAGPRFEDTTYLAQKAAFHSRVHKHADHLTFLWFDHGRDILIDPGRYAYAGKTRPETDLYKKGFWYSDPKRIYVESTRAHNCVEIDGCDHQRTEVRPFGTGLVSAVEQAGLALFESAVVHNRTIRQKRRLILRPGHFLLVLDWLNDGAGAEHSYRQYFKFAPEWVIEAEKMGFCARHPGRDLPEEYRESIAPITLKVGTFSAEAEAGAALRGQTDPVMAGWASPAAYAMAPATSIHFVQTAQRRPARFATLFTFGETLAIDSVASRMNASMSAARFVWSDDRGSNTIVLQAAEGGFEARYALN